MAKKRQLEQIKIQDAIGNAFQEFADLGQEMRDWYDNMPESFQNADKGSTVSEAADNLENLNEPSIDDAMSDLLLTLGDTQVLPMKRRASRPTRRDHAVDLLSAAKSAIEEYLNGNEEFDLRDELDSLMNELDEAIGEAEAVEFPGMYG